MLRSMEGTLNARGLQKRVLGQDVASVAVLALGVATVALRGFAQQPAVESPPADKPVARVARATSVATRVDPTLGMFKRKPLTPSVIADNGTGMAVIRIRELMERPELKSYLPLINRSLTAWLDSEFPGAGAKPVHIEAIDWVAAQAHISIQTLEDDQSGESGRPSQVDQSGKSGRLTLGTNGIVVKLREPFDLSNWIERYAPDSKRYVIEARDVFQLPVIASLGPTPLWITMGTDGTLLTSTTLVEVTPDTTIGDIFPTSLSKDYQNESGWVPAWNRIEGGLGSVVFTDAGFKEVGDVGAADDPLGREAAQLALALYERCSQLSYGIDTLTNGSDLGVRIRLTHASIGPAEQSNREIRKLIDLAKSELAEEFGVLASDRVAETQGSKG